MHANPRNSGFTLTEVLMAMGIFLLGVIFVAAIFPAAALLQKETVTEVRVDQAARSVRALLTGMKFDHTGKQELRAAPTGLVDGDPDATGMVHRFVPISGDNPKTGGWTLRDRTYPAVANDLHSAEIYWVPLVCDADPDPGEHDWRVFAFVLTRNANTRWTSFYDGDDSANPEDGWDSAGFWRTPNVRRVAVTLGKGPNNRDMFQFNNTINGDYELKIGDWLLSSNGYVYRVYEAHADGVEVDGFIDHTNSDVPDFQWQIWYAPPGSSGINPCKRIIMLTHDDAVK